MCANVAINETCDTDKAPFFGAVCLLGLGVTGQAVLEYFRKHPQSLKSLTVYTGAATPETQAYAAQLPADITVYLDCEDVCGSYDTAVVSPGIAPTAPIYQSALACCRELISEPELAWRLSPQNWIAITGTNGKTTVTELTAHLLNSVGLRAQVAGNIGTSCIQVVSERRPGDFLVAELSSYQLHSSVELAPDVAVLLNITPDHLHWHGSFADYAADKLRILANLDPTRPAIIDATLPETRAVVRQLRREGRRVIALGTSAGIYQSMVVHCGAAEAAFVDADSGQLRATIQGRQLDFGSSARLQLKGPHNLSNALAAAVCASCAGLSEAQISTGLASFRPLEHRFEPCGEIDGVSFINDSKATNTDAAIEAIIASADDLESASGARVLVLLGGVDKGTELADLAVVCQDSCSYAVCYGEAAERFCSALAPVLPTLRQPDLDAAFWQAVELARPGDVVLLAPACASFDEFDSFEARGAAFKAKVQQLRERSLACGLSQSLPVPYCDSAALAAGGEAR